MPKSRAGNQSLQEVQSSSSAQGIYRNVFSSLGTAILVASSEHKPLLANPRFLELSGYSQQDLQQMQSWAQILDQKSSSRVLDWIAENHLSAEHPHNFESSLVCRNQEEKQVYITLSAAREPGWVLVSLIDISELKKAEGQLFYKAFHDHLTGLANQALFKEVLSLAIRRARRSRNYMFSVLYLDIDRFKWINDTLGHVVGDKLLQGFTSRVQQCLRKSDTMARMGGDEFAVLLEDIQGLDYTTTVVNRIFNSLQEPLQIQGQSISVQVSVGIVSDCRKYQDSEDIIRDADLAMYKAKNEGRSCYQVFEQQMQQRFRHIQELEEAMHHALENQEFLLYYQPIVCLQTGKVECFEALLRWERPGNSLVSPDEFIPVAEKTGFILSLTSWILQQACFQMKKWQQRYPSLADCSVGVNLSLRQLQDEKLEQKIVQALQDSSLPAANLQLEIAEIQNILNQERIIDQLMRIRELGVKIMVDDFGTGYASLNFLHRYPVDYLKIDRTVVDLLHSASSEQDMKRVHSIIRLAHSLDLQVVAEGVEKAVQNNLLNQLNCQFAQGYLYYRPMSPDLMQEDFLRRISSH